MERIGEDSNSILGNSTGSFPRPCRMTGNPKVMSPGLVPRNALVLNKPINSETDVREVVWSAAGRSAHNCQTPRNGVRGDRPRVSSKRTSGQLRVLRTFGVLATNSLRTPRVGKSPRQSPLAAKA